MKLFDEFKNKFGDKKDIPVINCMHCGKEFITYDDLTAHIPNCKFRKEAYKMISNFGDEVLTDVKKEEKISRQTNETKGTTKKKLKPSKKRVSKKAKKSKQTRKKSSKKVKISKSKKSKSVKKSSHRKTSRRNSKKKSKRR